jgi:anaerobic ribonucleoside-triphosphate reductase activating protein
MNYAEIKYYDIANGPGVRISLFVSGCRRGCKNCFNQSAWEGAKRAKNQDKSKKMH